MPRPLNHAVARAKRSLPVNRGAHMGKLRSAHGTFGPTGQMSSIKQHFRGGSRHRRSGSRRWAARILLDTRMSLRYPAIVYRLTAGCPPAACRFHSLKAQVQSLRRICFTAPRHAGSLSACIQDSLVDSGLKTAGMTTHVLEHSTTLQCVKMYRGTCPCRSPS